MGLQVCGGNFIRRKPIIADFSAGFRPKRVSPRKGLGGVFEQSWHAPLISRFAIGESASGGSARLS